MIDVDTTSEVGDDFLHARWPMLSSAPTSAMASLALLAMRLRTMPTGSARRTARSVVTSAIFSNASASMPALIRSRSNRAICRGGVLTFTVKFDPTSLDVDVWKAPPVACDLGANLNEIGQTNPPLLGR